MEVKLLNYTPEPEQAIIKAAANCWQSTPRAEILDHIIQAGHWTPLEFAVFNFEISGVSRALTHQLVRKRVGVAFAQESQRYVEKHNFDYVIPDSIKSRGDKSILSDYCTIMDEIAIMYGDLIFLGIPPEDARYILPNACTSTIHMSINYHALLDLAKERLCSRAQWEIRELVQGLKLEVSTISPILASYMRPKCDWLGECPEGRECELYAGK